METWNPLDWTAEPFLLLYAAFAGSVLWLLLAWRSRLGADAPAPSADGLDVLHLAYLSGGAERAAGAALVGLLEAGAAVPDRKRALLRFDPSVPVAKELQPFRHVSGGETRRSDFQMEFSARWTRLHRELAGRGLLPSDAEVARFQWRGAMLLCVPLLLGVCKVLVGSSRDRPVGILVVLLLLTGVFGALLLTRRPHCNHAGAAALATVRQAHARAARAPLPEEMALAFALSGAAVLAGREYRSIVSSRSSSSTSDSSSSDGGGGDGGGGCGGCSG